MDFAFSRIFAKSDIAGILRVDDRIPLEVRGVDREPGILGTGNHRVRIGETKEFDLLVAGCGDLFQGARGILAERVAQRVKLDADVLADRNCRPRGPAGFRIG